MRLLFFILFSLTLYYNGVSATFVTTQNGDFNNVNTWVGGVVPTATDDVEISHNVYISFGTNINSVTIKNGGVLRSNSGAVNLTISGNLSIEAGGNYQGVYLIVNFLNLIFNGTSTYTNAGTCSFKNIAVNTGKTLTLNSSIASGLLNISSISINGSLYCGTNTISLDGVSSFSLNSGATLQTANPNGVQATIDNSLLGITTYDNNASYIFSTGCTNTGFGSINTLKHIGLDAVTINNTTDFTMSGGFQNISPGSSFNANGLSTTITMQGVSSSSSSGYNVKVDYLHITGTHSSFSNLLIYNTLEIDASASLVVSASRTFSLQNNANIISSGSLSVANFEAVGNNTGESTISAGVFDNLNGYKHNSGTFTLSSTNSNTNGSATFSNLNITANFNSTNATSIEIIDDLFLNSTVNSNLSTFNMQGGNIYGSGSHSIGAINIFGNTSLNSVSLTANNSMNLSAGTFDIQGNSLIFDFSPTRTSGNIDATDPNCIIYIGGSSNINVPANTFVSNSISKLYLYTNATVSLNNNLIVSSILDLNNAGLILDMQNYNLSIGGSITTNIGSIDLTDNSSTLTLNTSSNITLPTFVSNECGNLYLSNNSTGTLANNLRVNGTLTLNNAGLLFDVTNKSLTIDNPIVSNAGAIDLTDNSSTLNLAFTGATAFSSGAFLNGEVGNLSISGSSTITLGSNADIDGDFTMNNANALFDISTYRLRLGGGINYTAGSIDATDASSTLSFAGSSPITFNTGVFSSTGDIGSLELLQSSTITQVGNLGVQSNLYVNNAGLYYDLQANEFGLSGDISYTSGTLDFTDASSTFLLSSNSPFTLNSNYFKDQKLGVLDIQRGGLVTLLNDLEVQGKLYLNNTLMDLDIETNDITLTLDNGWIIQTPGPTKFQSQTGGTLKLQNSSPLNLNGADFENYKVYNLILNNSTTTTLTDDFGVDNTLTMTAASPTFSLEGVIFVFPNILNYTAGLIDATNNSCRIDLWGAGNLTLPDVFKNREVGYLDVAKNGTITLGASLNVDNDLYFNSASSTFDLNSNTLTINDDVGYTAGYFDAQDNGSAFVIASGVNTLSYSGNWFINNTINELYVNEDIALTDNLIIEDVFNIDNGSVDIQGTNVEIQGDINLYNTGAISTANTNSLTFSNFSTMTNNSTGIISLNDLYVTGTLNTTASATIGGNFNVSGVSNFTSGTTTFDNSTSKTITNTGTLDFNYVNIGSGADIRTTSNFDLKNDFRMVDNTSVFVASSPSEITLDLNNMQIFSETNSDGASSGLTFYSLRIANSANIYFRGAYDFYINGNMFFDSGRLFFENGSNLIFTRSGGLTSLGNLTCDNLTFESTASFGDFRAVSQISGTITNEAGADNTLYITTLNDVDNVIINTAPNNADNLRFYNLNLTNSITSSAQSFDIGNSLNVDASSTLTQSSGTFRISGGSITNNGRLNLNDFEVYNSPITSSGFTIEGDYFLQNAGYSFTASAGSITFTKPNLTLNNSGTTQFFSLVFDDAVTNGTTDDDFTIAGGLTLGATSYFTASSPSEITLSGSNTITCPSHATGAQGLFLNDLNVTGNYTTNSPGSEIIIAQINGNLNVSGDIVFSNFAGTRFTGSSKTITNTGNLEFDYFWLPVGSYETISDFEINRRMAIGNGTSFQANAGTIYLSGASCSISNNAGNDISDFQFNNLEATNSDAYGSGSFSILGDITVNNSSSFTHSTGEIRFIDGGTHTIYNDEQLIFNDLSIENANTVQTSSDFTVKSDIFDLLGATSSFTALAGEVTFKVNSSSATITSGGGLGSVVFNDLHIDDSKSLYIQDNLDIIINGNFTADASANLYTAGTTNFYFQGSTQQTISVENGAEINFQNLTLDNSTGLNLDNSIAVDELNVYKDLRLSDGDLNLNGGNILTLQEPLAFLYETEGIVKNSINDDSQLGHIYYDYTFNSTLNTLNFAGLGIGFKQGAGANPFGQTIIKRYHTSVEVAGGNSVQRMFGITTANDGIEARPIFSYYESELNNQDEANLILASTRTIDDFWAAITTKNQYQINRLESQDTIDQFTDFNTLWTAVVPLTVSLSELEERVDQNEYPNSRLIAGSKDNLILAFQVSATDFTNLTAIKLFVPDNKRQFQNFKLYSSNDQFFNSNNDNELLISVTYGQDSVEFNGLPNIEINPSNNGYFFITADVSDSVTIFADSVLVYLNQACFTISRGIIKLETIGTKYYNFQQRIDAIYNPIGISESPLLPNTINIPIFGFEIQPLGNEAGLTSFDLNFSNSPLLALSGNLKLYHSIDNDYATNDDNSLIDLSNELSISSNKTYTFELLEEEIIESVGEYYFIVVDSISNNANDGTNDLILSIPQQSLRSSRAAPVATDTISGSAYTFADLDVTIVSSDYIPEGNIFKEGRNQNLFGFTLSVDNTAKFVKLVLNYEVTNGLLPVNHLTNIKLWQDLNNNKVADQDEDISVGKIDGNYFVFEPFSKNVVFENARNFFVTADIRNSAPINSTIKFNIPSNDYVSFNSPAKVEAGGPYLGTIRTISQAPTPNALSISNIYPTFIQSGDHIDVTIKTLDINGNETIADQKYDITINVVGDVAKSGNYTGSILKGQSYITITNLVLTNDDGATPVYLTTDNSELTEAISSTFTLYPLSPATNSSELALSDGNPNTSSIQIESWTNGDGDGRIIVARLGRPPASPENEIIYSAENNINQSIINSNQTQPGSFVIYNGTDNSVPFKLNDLMSNSTYFFKIFEYKLFNGKPIYLNNENNPTYFYSTSESNDETNSNSDSSTATIIYEDFIVDGHLANDSEIDWYKFTSTKKNILINSCGEFLYIDLYKINPANNKLQLVRRTQNTGTNCQVILMNNNSSGTYYIKVHRLNGVESADYQFKVRSYNNELFSRATCECP